MRIKFSVKSVTLKFNIRKYVGRFRTQFFIVWHKDWALKKNKNDQSDLRYLFSNQFRNQFISLYFRYLFTRKSNSNCREETRPLGNPKPSTGNELFCSISRKTRELAHRAKQVSLICTQGR